MSDGAPGPRPRRSALGSLHYTATFAVGFFLAWFLQQVVRLTPQITGVLLVAQPAVMALFSPLAGRLSELWEPRWMASLGMAGTALALSGLARLASTKSLTEAVVFMALLGLGFALFSAPNPNAVMSSVPATHLAQAAAVLSTMRLLRQALSLTLAGYLLPTSAGTPDLLVLALRRSMWLFSLLCFVGVGFSLARGPVRHNS